MEVIIGLLFIFLLIILTFSICNTSARKYYQTSKTNIFNKLYGYSCPRNPYTKEFDILIKQWHKIAKSANISYSITYGTYLGWLRHRDYIPYDMDIDVHIGRESVDKLIGLSKYNWCCEPRELRKHPLKVGVPRLLLNPLHDEPVHDKYRSRYNCRGISVNSQEDGCSFCGPIARLIYPCKDRQLHIDIFVYYIEKDIHERRKIQERGFASDFDGPFAVFVTSKYGSILPPVKKCKLHGITTSCFRDAQYFMESAYGKNYIKPNKTWDKSGKWVPN